MMAWLKLLVASALVTISQSFVVCPDKEVAFYHVPKAAGLHRIVDRLYARDFELLGYQKVNARMMRLCGQRAARQAALASQQRLPVVRRKPKKYRGPTRTPPASQRNNAPQEEEFGRHMKKWLEGEQVPLMPTE